MTTTWPNILISAFTESNNELSASSAAVELHHRRQLTKHTSNHATASPAPSMKVNQLTLELHRLHELGMPCPRIQERGRGQHVLLHFQEPLRPRHLFQLAAQLKLFTQQH